MPNRCKAYRAFVQRRNRHCSIRDHEVPGHLQTPKQDMSGGHMVDMVNTRTSGTWLLSDHLIGTKRSHHSAEEHVIQTVLASEIDPNFCRVCQMKAEPIEWSKVQFHGQLYYRITVFYLYFDTDLFFYVFSKFRVFRRYPSSVIQDEGLGLEKRDIVDMLCSPQPDLTPIPCKIALFLLCREAKYLQSRIKRLTKTHHATALLLSLNRSLLSQRALREVAAFCGTTGFVYSLRKPNRI